MAEPVIIRSIYQLQFVHLERETADEAIVPGGKTKIMKLRPSESLSEEQVQSGLNLVVKDGLAAEAMATLTGGAFLVSIALHLGASNFQIGLLAALPTITNLFPLVAIWLVQRFNNRRAITVICSIFARTPLLMIGLLPFLFSSSTSVEVLIFFLSFHYFFGAISGTSWNSWMKDLVPQKMLGTYFSHRSRLTQILNVTLSLVIAVTLDFIKSHYPQYEIPAYSIMFLAGGTIGMLGVYLLARTPEPKSHLRNENMVKLFRQPLKDKNFRNLIIFHSFWAFALNLATPFFSVYLLKTIHLPLSYIIALSILSQLSSIFSIRLWGRTSDKYSNKTIIGICAPVYIGCILAWTFIGSYALLTLPLLILINICSGCSTAGINLAMSNIGMKLAPRGEAIVYISTRGMITAFFSAIAPMIGGLMADFFSTHQLSWSVEWTGPKGTSMFNVLNLQNWSFFFVIGALLAACALRLLKNVREEGEVEKDVVVTEIVTNFKTTIKKKTSREALRSIYNPSFLPASTPKENKYRA